MVVQVKWHMKFHCIDKIKLWSHTFYKTNKNPNESYWSSGKQSSCNIYIGDIIRGGIKLIYSGGGGGGGGGRGKAAHYLRGRRCYPLSSLHVQSFVNV